MHGIMLYTSYNATGLATLLKTATKVYFLFYLIICQTDAQNLNVELWFGLFYVYM
jgi:hypothetical protein